MPWPPDTLTWLGVTTDGSEGDVVTVAIGTPAGRVDVMAVGAHIQCDAGPNALGIANLHAIAELILERIDCDEATIEGAPRTTGANPGHRPRVIRFTRRSHSASQ